ncbi:MAG: DUF4091 domain-containing protein, partial [Desulfobacteraceae bacterium]
TGSFATEDDGTALRALAWIQYKFRIDHWFYWNVNFWTDNQFGGGDTNVFQNATTTGCGGTKDPLYGYINGTAANNGDGVLIYPGTDNIYTAESYNVNGPIGGVRLKAWRRGIQDADYLTLAAQIDATAVNQLVRKMIKKALFEVEYNNPDEPTWGAKGPMGWSNDPDVWEAARKELADIIDGGVPQSITLNAGWNWISFSVLPTNLSPSSVFAGILGQVEQLKTQTRSAIRSSGNWKGDLSDMSGIGQNKMFKVKVSAACTLTEAGTAIAANMPISLTAGWNWVAFLPTTSMPTATALASISGQVQEVKSLTQSALYDGTSWSGTLTQLEPGKGYTIRMMAPGTLTYPASTMAKHKKRK